MCRQRPFKKIITNVLILLTIICAPAVGNAQAEPPVPPVLSLQEAILLALRYNPDVQNEEIQRIADKFALRVAQNAYELQYALLGSANISSFRVAGDSETIHSADLSPAVGLQGVYGTEYGLEMNNVATNGNYNPGVNATIIQPLIRGFGKEVTLAPLEIAEVTELISRLTLKKTLMQTVANVISNYNSLVQSQNDVEIARLSLQSYKSTIDLDNALIKAGRKAPTEVLQAQAQYASREVDLQNSENTVQSNMLSLMNTLGLSPDIKFSITKELPVEKFKNFDFDDCYAIAAQNNIELLVTKLNLKTAKKQLLLAEDGARVQLDLTLSAATGNGVGADFNSGFASLTNNKNSELSAGLTLAVPIDNYALKQSVLDAKLLVKKSKINVETAERVLKSTIMNVMLVSIVDKKRLSWGKLRWNYNSRIKIICSPS